MQQGPALRFLGSFILRFAIGSLAAAMIAAFAIGAVMLFPLLH
jgi:hypothetical protein